MSAQGVLHLTHQGGESGSTISIALLARAQQRAGWRVAVACPPGTWLAELAREAGVAWAPVAFDGIGAAVRGIEALVQGLAPDVVNSHGSRDRAACRRLRFARRLRPALVMTRRAMPLSTPLSATLSGLAADRVIAVSRPVARSLVRRGTPRSRVRVVPNAVDLERIDRPVREAECAAAAAGIGVVPGRPVLGVVTRLFADPALRARLGAAASAHARTFTIERTLAATDAVYREARERRGLA